jgi:hypothetical protein
VAIPDVEINMLKDPTHKLLPLLSWRWVTRPASQSRAGDNDEVATVWRKDRDRPGRNDG